MFKRVLNLEFVYDLVFEIWDLLFFVRLLRPDKSGLAMTFCSSLSCDIVSDSNQWR
jgi:hypothetical protein